MPSIEEITNGAANQLADSLAAGLGDISQHQIVPFLTYKKFVLPLDGFVFWVRNNKIEASGMVHFMTEREQVEDETATRNTIVFTTTAEVQCLNDANTQDLVIGRVEGRSYAFGRIGWYNPQANLWHYQGEAIHPAMATQLIDSASQLDATTPIVNDSLPAWLTLQTYLPIWITWPGMRNPQIPLYPSYLVPDNLVPPYGSVHIEPASIQSLQAARLYDRDTWSSSQLTSEEVRVTLYGCNNNTATDFLNLVMDYSYYYDVIGIMNMPVVRDDKRPWPEGMVIAQKKVIDFTVSYVQTRITTIARQLITSAQAAVYASDLLLGQTSNLVPGA